MSVAFLVTSLIVVVTPGAGVLYTLGAGLSQGARASVFAAIGCTLGIVPHMLAATTGLAVVLQASPLAFEILKYLGVAYLVYMAWSTLRDKSGLRVDERAPSSARRIITRGVLVNILNPKLTVFFFAFLPQFTAADDSNAFWRMTGQSLVFMAMTLVVFALYGMFASAVRRHLISRPAIMAWMRRAFAAVFVALAARLATG